MPKLFKQPLDTSPGQVVFATSMERDLSMLIYHLRESASFRETGHRFAVHPSAARSTVLALLRRCKWEFARGDMRTVHPPIDVHLPGAEFVAAWRALPSLLGPDDTLLTAVRTALRYRNGGVDVNVVPLSKLTRGRASDNSQEVSS